MIRKDADGKRRSAGLSTWSVLLTIIPLWALWVFAYVSLSTLQEGMEALPRFYGMHLFKEQVRMRLERAAREMDRGMGRSADGETERREVELWLRFEPSLVVVDLRALEIVYPPPGQRGMVGFPGGPAQRAALLEILRKMVRNGSREGYFSLRLPVSSGSGSVERWFLSVEPAGLDHLCILPVPERVVKASGDILQEAQEALLAERRRLFVMASLPVVLLSSVLLIYLGMGRRSGSARP